MNDTVKLTITITESTQSAEDMAELLRHIVGHPDHHAPRNNRYIRACAHNIGPAKGQKFIRA